MKRTVLNVSLAAMMILCSGAVSAADGQSSQSNEAGTAKLYRVDEGIFELREGELLDLTDRAISLHVPKNQNRELAESDQKIKVTLTSNRKREINLSVGDRVNLKGRDGYGAYTDDSFKDKAICNLDLIKVTVPKGAPVIGTFRFKCE